ncbi:MAG: hypothetical protein QW231_06090, partial [Candidatus Bathyarchaeia archaeon]
MTINFAPWTALLALWSVFVTPALTQSFNLPGYFVEPVITDAVSREPVTLEFLGNEEFLLCERRTGRVRYYRNAQFQGIVFDLP